MGDAPVSWALVLGVWALVAVFVLLHHFSLARNKIVVRAEGGNPESVTTTQRDLVVLELRVLSLAFVLLVVRAILGRSLALGLPMAGVLCGAAFAAGVYWFHSDAVDTGKTGGYGDSVRPPDSIWLAMALVFAVATTGVALFLVLAMVLAP